MTVEANAKVLAKLAVLRVDGGICSQMAFEAFGLHLNFVADKTTVPFLQYST